MDLTTKIILIIASILIIGGLCFTLIYYRDDIFGERITSTTTTEISTITQDGMSEEEIAYVNSITSLDLELVEVITNLNDLMAAPNISDQDWCDSLSLVHGEIMQLHDAATKMQVPNNTAAQLQTYYVNNITRNLLQSVQWVSSAIQQGNVELLNNAIAHMEAIEGARANFFTQLNSYVASYN
ncbi:MAG TPA: hypothetical protein DCR71_03530 [Dehalococcoidia bacterium]|jgi:uncharacterized protein YjgD (DUF1641 family)|nr:hypothetical protein [Dehalococcoidia bacterium]HAS28508.1 hypothetical protein [Dehalococcoidia bacterium]